MGESWRKILSALWLIGLGLTVWASLTPGEEMPSTGLNDKLMHLSTYFFLAGLPAVSLYPLKKALWAALAMIPFGAALEFGQLAVPGRSFEPADIAANTLGAGLGLTLGLVLAKRRKPQA